MNTLVTLMTLELLYWLLFLFERNAINNWFKTFHSHVASFHFNLFLCFCTFFSAFLFCFFFLVKFLRSYFFVSSRSDLNIKNALYALKRENRVFYEQIHAFLFFLFVWKTLEIEMNFSIIVVLSNDKCGWLNFNSFLLFHLTVWKTIFAHWIWWIVWFSIVYDNCIL